MGDTVEIIVKGKGADISNDFSEPINIPTEQIEAKLGIKGFATYNNIPNIVVGVNNQIKIKVPGHEYRVFALETGAYELETISEQIMGFLGVTYPKLEHIEEDFKLVANYATSKAEFRFKKDGYGVDFDLDASLYSLLGFDKTD